MTRHTPKARLLSRQTPDRPHLAAVTLVVILEIIIVVVVVMDILVALVVLVPERECAGCLCKVAAHWRRGAVDPPGRACLITWGTCKSSTTIQSRRLQSGCDGGLRATR